MSVETSVVRPPITPASATGPSRSQINRSWSVSVALDIVEGPQAFARAGVPHDDPGPARRARSKPCNGWPSSSIA